MTTEQWGNIELPGLSDEELYAKNWIKDRLGRDSTNIIASNKARDPVKQAEACRKASLLKHQDPVFQAKYRQGREKIYVKYQDPNGQVWPSRKAAAEAWNILPQTLSKLASKPDSGWAKL